MSKILDDLVRNCEEHVQIIKRRNAEDLGLTSRVYQKWSILDGDSRLRETVMEIRNSVNNREVESIIQQHHIISSAIYELKCNIDELYARADPVIEPITIRIEFLDCSFVVVIINKTDHVYEIKKQVKSQGFPVVSLIKQDNMVLDDLMIASDVLIDGEVICGICDPNCVTTRDILKRLDSLVECVIDIKGRLPVKN